MASSHSNILAQNPSNRSKEISLFTKKVNLKNDDQDLYEKRDRSFTYVIYLVLFSTNRLLL